MLLARVLGPVVATVKHPAFHAHKLLLVQPVDETGKAFGELELHLAIYRARPDANAVIHAHPPHAMAFGVSGVSLEIAAMPEFLVSLGAGVPTVPLFLPKTPELVNAVADTSKKAHA